MIDPVFLFLLILVVVLFYNALLFNGYWSRFICAIMPGFLVLGYAGAHAIALSIICYIAFFMLYLLSRNSTNKRIKNYLPYLGLTALLIPDYSNAIKNHDILFIGSAFFIVRQFVTVKECIKQGADIKTYLLSSSLASWFFASLFTGPIFSGLDINQQLKQQKPDDNRNGVYKLIEGFAFILPVSEFINYLQAELSMIEKSGNALLEVSIQIIGQPVLAFAFIFSTFFGYSKVAEGTANLFGFSVPVNFNQPHKAKDFSDFWQRWHRSMADFVMKYLYLPISINLKNPKLGLYAAFVFMGLWHNISPGYFVWGLAHATALAWIQPALKKRNLSPGAFRLVTLIFVIYISYTANVWLS